MFCGFDAYHEANQRSSSIIAIVASIDKSTTRWTSGTARHARGQEISDKITELFRDCLQRWHNVSEVLLYLFIFCARLNASIEQIIVTRFR